MILYDKELNIHKRPSIAARLLSIVVDGGIMLASKSFWQAAFNVTNLEEDTVYAVNFYYVVYVITLC
jgi:hypothetical protein